MNGSNGRKRYRSRKLWMTIGCILIASFLQWFDHMSETYAALLFALLGTFTYGNIAVKKDEAKMQQYRAQFMKMYKDFKSKETVR